ncbi:MAG: alpha/beta-type small acid-soluble spore protein [Firmicutes bacterium]|nr:alpha/beta-type small acid-soluble spore protein [Bacillota bacterium]
MAERSRKTIVPRAESALDEVKYEVANELGLLEKIKSQGWGEMTTREVGRVGGQMVRRLIHAAEESLVQENKTNKG